MRYQQTLRIQRPVAEVFAYVTDPTNLPQWDTDVRAGRQVSDDPMGAGTEIEIIRTVPPFRRLGTFSGRITEYVPDDTLAVSIDEGPTPFDLRYEFSDKQDVTDLAVTIASHPRGVLKMIEPLVGRAIRRQVAAHYESLKSVLERREAAEH